MSVVNSECSQTNQFQPDITTFNIYIMRCAFQHLFCGSNLFPFLVSLLLFICTAYFHFHLVTFEKLKTDTYSTFILFKHHFYCVLNYRSVLFFRSLSLSLRQMVKKQTHVFFNRRQQRILNKRFHQLTFTARETKNQSLNK